MKTVELTAIIDESIAGSFNTIPKEHYAKLAGALLDSFCTYYHGKHALALFGNKVGSLDLHLEEDVPRIEFRMECPDNARSDDLGQEMKVAWNKAVGFDCESYISIY